MNERAIFDARRVLETKRQPTYAARLAALATAIANRQDGHPYSMTLTEQLELARHNDDFAGGLHGWQSNVAFSYLYRITSIGTLLRNGIAWRHRVSDEIAFERLTIRYHETGDEWLPLSEFATGDLSNFRGFSWWTPWDLTSGNIWDAWRRIGLLDNWITRETVLLRCTVNDTCPPRHVPTGLDAFDGPVFEAAKETPHRSDVGYTINLAQHELSRGEQELLVAHVPSALIHLRPVLVEDEMKDRGTPAYNHPNTWQRLLAYYHACHGTIT